MHPGSCLQVFLVLCSVCLCQVLGVVITSTTRSNSSATWARVVSRVQSASFSPWSVPDARHVRWAEAAYMYIHTLDCREVFFTTEKECRDLQHLSKSDLSIYIADPSPFGRLLAILPDGGLSRAGVHDAFLVVDPYPRANFGHLVLVFYIDMHTNNLWCHREGGKFLCKYLCSSPNYHLIMSFTSTWMFHPKPPFPPAAAVNIFAPAQSGIFEEIIFAHWSHTMCEQC